MTSWRLYNLYRRAGNSPCQAFRLMEARSPYLVSAALYVVAAILAVATAVIGIAG